MALGKIRTNKRPSGGTSYASTVTTVVFVTLCVLGVWMMTSTSIVPPQTATTRSNAATNTDFPSSNTKESHPIENTQPVFEDNPGRLPEDAIKSDEQAQSKGGTTTTTTTIQEDNLKNSANSDTLVDSNNKDGGGVQDVSNVIENQQGAEELKQNEIFQKQVAENNIKQEVANQNNPQVFEDNPNPDSVHHGSEEQHETSTQTEDHHPDITKQDENQMGNLHERGNQQQDQTQHQETLQEIHEGSSHEQIEHDEAMPMETHSSNEEQMPQETTNTKQTTQVDSTNTRRSGLKRKRVSKIDHSLDMSIQSNPEDSILGGGKEGIPKESKESKKSWATQAGQSMNEKVRQKNGAEGQGGGIYGYKWQMCNVTAGTDYIPCLDNEKAILKLRSRAHFQHRERHCPEEAPTCLVPVPEGYRTPIEWPKSREKVW